MNGSNDIQEPDPLSNAEDILLQVLYKDFIPYDCTKTINCDEAYERIRHLIKTLRKIQEAGMHGQR